MREYFLSGAICVPNIFLRLSLLSNSFGHHPRPPFAPENIRTAGSEAAGLDYDIGHCDE